MHYMGHWTSGGESFSEIVETAYLLPRGGGSFLQFWRGSSCVQHIHLWAVLGLLLLPSLLFNYWQQKSTLVCTAFPRLTNMYYNLILPVPNFHTIVLTYSQNTKWTDFVHTLHREQLILPRGKSTCVFVTGNITNWILTADVN